MNLYTTGHGAKIDSRQALRLLGDLPLRRNVYVKLISKTFGVGDRASQLRLKEFIAECLVVVEGSPRMVCITDAGRRFRDGWRRGPDAIRAIVSRTPRNAYSKRSQLRELDRIPNRRPAGLSEASPPHMVLPVDKIGVPIHDEWPEVSIRTAGTRSLPSWACGGPASMRRRSLLAALDPKDLDEHGRPAYFQVWGRWEPDEEAQESVSLNPAV
jgi:hypothetical protein